MTHSKKSRVLALLLSFVMVLSMLPQTIFATADAHITVTEPQAQEISTGAQLKIYMDEIFTDTEGHGLTYSLDDGDYGQHTKLAQDTDGRWMLSFTNAAAGSYTPTVTATCAGGDKASVQLQITVKAAAEGSDSQYGYDETDAESVRVSVTVSSDGVPILGYDGSTVLSHLEVEVPYFDLDKQGLSDYYRYHTENGQGSYVDSVVVKRPTALHLYLYLLGVYYLGLSPEDVTTGRVQITEQAGMGGGVLNMNGDVAYDDTNDALCITGSPTSLYMQNFWGHDENLMYYRNHVYPLMSDGWGSTADYILLSDGDTIDLAMFTNWEFWTRGAFAAFDQDEYSVAPGGSLIFQTLKYDTQSVADGGSEQFDPITGLSVAVYDSEWNRVDTVAPLSTGGSSYSYTFPQAGTYYLLAMDPNAGTSDSCYAPATAKVTVGGGEAAFDPDSYYADYDFSAITLDAAGTEYIYNIEESSVYVEHFSNPGDKKLYTVTVPSGTQTVYVTYPADFATEIGEYCAVFDDTGAPSWDYYAGSDYEYSVTENDDGSHTLALPAAFLMENSLSIAAQDSGYEYFNCFKFVAGDNTRPGGSSKVSVTGISISQAALTVDRYETAQLSAQVLPENASNQCIRWSSSDSSVATVDSSGLVSAVKEGVAAIIVSSMDGGFTATCTVTVTDSNKPAQDESGCYEISTGRQLLWFAREVNNGSYAINGKLMNDVELSDICSASLGRWIPIGNQADNRRYEGVFDGQGHAVRGLYLTGDPDLAFNIGSSYYTGLFGLCDGATIKNLSVYGELVGGYRYMAGIVGRMCQVSTRRGGTIENCHSYVNFSGTPTNNQLYGYAGIVATADGATISGCSNHGYVYGLQGETGGIVAAASGCLIANCWNEGDVQLRGYQSDFRGVGGIAGVIEGTTSVTNCYNTGDISFYYRTQALPQYAGGIVGLADGKSSSHELRLSYCYNVGTVSGDLDDKASLGGIVGHVYDTEKVSATALQCYYLDSSAAQDALAGTEALSAAQMHAAAFASKLGVGYVASCPYPVLANQTATPHVDADEDGQCDNCGGNICPHPNAALQNTVPPTCTAPGYSGDLICPDCGETVSTGHELPATGHQFTDGQCDNCGLAVATRKDGVEATAFAKVKTGMAYLLSDLQRGNIFQAPEGSSLNYQSYYYQRSTDGGETWGAMQSFSTAIFGATTISLTETEEGTYTYRFYASVDGGVTLSADTWTLTLQVMDNPDFDFTFRVGKDYSGDYPIIKLYRVETGEDGQEVLGEELTDCFLYSDFTATLPEGQEAYDPALGQLVDGYQTFYASLVSGRYAYRAFAKDEDGNYTVALGGMTLDLPTDTNVDGAASGGTDIYLKCVSYYTSSKKTDNSYFTAKEYHMRLVCPIMGCEASFGTAYTKGNYAYYPVVLYAAGNACLYNVYAYPDIDGYIFNQAINKTYPASSSAGTENLAINPAIELKVTAPEDADFGLYFQWNNFNTTEVEPGTAWSSNDDGTKSATYQISKGNGNYSWRLSDDSHVTQAGWLSQIRTSTEMSFTFADDAPTDRLSHDRTQLGTAVSTRDEADLQVNLDPSGSRFLSDTTRVRAYRHWQLINTDAGNIMVEPDYHWTRLTGDASISTVSGGNASANWADITPGTEDSIITVAYDAIDVSHGSYGTHGGFFPATAPQRVGVIVVPGTGTTAGSGDADVDFNMAVGGSTTRSLDWDYNYDTWYYEAKETAPALTFAVKVTGSATVEYAFVTADNSLNVSVTDWQTVSTADGRYSVPLATFRSLGNGLGGTVILRISDETGVSYRLVRVAQVTITAENVTHRGEDIMPGDQVKLSFQGLFRGVNKVSGIFNPTNFYPRYSAGGVEYSGTLSQYQRMDNATITVTIPEDIEFPAGQDSVAYALTNGYTYGSMYSAANPFALLYNMTDTGVGTNFNAVTVNFFMNHYADAVITVHRTVYYDTALAVADQDGNILEDYSLTLTDGQGQVLTPGENGRWQLSYGSYHYALLKDGYVCTYGSFSLGSADAAKLQDGVLTITLTMEKAGENAWDGKTATQPKQDENGVYLIGNAEELAWFAAAVNGGETAISARLTADIQLTGFAWTPIGNNSQKYAGSFDGCGHVIHNLYISSSANYQALFGYLASGASVTRLGVNGNVSTTGNYAAGIVAYMANGSSVTDCFSAVSVTAAKWAGGIAGGGQSYLAEISDCYNVGSVTATGAGYAGGIVSCGSSTSLGPTVSNCYNVGTVSGKATVGPVTACTGNNSYGGNCYYLAGCCENASASTRGEAKTADELRQLAPTLGERFAADEDSINGGFPILRWQRSLLLGDINGDGEIDIIDAGLLVRYCNDLAQLDEQQLLRADLNGDGEIDIIDAGLLVRYCNGLITTF